MDTNTATEQFFTKGTFDQDIVFFKSKTSSGIDIVHSDRGFNNLYDLLENTEQFNIIDYQATAESNMATYTRAALDKLPKKDSIVVGYVSEALNSVYWNVVFDIIKSHGYKKIVWIDGGISSGFTYNHLLDIQIKHKPGTMFFQVLNNNHTAGYPKEVIFKKRKYHFLSLGRLARRERIYFTKKILDDELLKETGIYTCGWGDSSIETIWNKDSQHDRENLLLFLNEKDAEKFPISLGHNDGEQHHMMQSFNEAVINVVQESSVGFDHRSHENAYSVIASSWCRVNSDRLFFTEKSAKPFLMSQIPLFIAAPGYVNQLRVLGFDLFDDIVDHSYDKEDYIFKRCDLVFNELKRLTNLYSLEGWNKLITNKLMHRFQRNFMLLQELSDDGKLAKWINRQLI
jgi:hypothetical protein